MTSEQLDRAFTAGDCWESPIRIRTGMRPEPTAKLISIIRN